MSATPDTRPEPVFVPTPAQRAVGLGITDFNSVLSNDPAVDAAIEWLESLGAPPPTSREDFVFAFPGSPDFFHQITWSNNLGARVPVEAGILARQPAITAILLAQAGFMKIPAGFVADVVPAYQAAALMPPPSPTIVFSSSPIGGAVTYGHVEIGAAFNPSATDSMVAGQQYTQKAPTDQAPAGSYLKFAGVRTLFGPPAYWIRTA